MKLVLESGEIIVESDLISIVIPVFNAEKTINQCISSIVSQSYFNIEILLIDDGSTDGSGCLCQKWMNYDSRILYVKKENGGVSSARNMGISKANGKYICFIDSDDTIDKDFIKILYNNIIKYNVQLSMCNYYKIYGKKKKFKNNKLGDVLILDNPKNFYDNFEKYLGFMCNKMFITKYVKKINLDENIHSCEDFIFLINYLKIINKSCYCDIPLYNYYINADGGSSWNWNSKRITIVEAYRYILKEISLFGNNTCNPFYIQYFYILLDIVYRYKYGYKYKIEMKEVYRNIVKNNSILFNDKIKVIIRYRFYPIRILIKKIYFKINNLQKTR